ncbi:DUF4145 domain-containing protein [Micromonospora sp. CPCC 205539]|uniref:DUF4145 domain-containing protein n=1 Tax=Micromonospora sp. CPCC 205539 TaxID=3122408 RepID=UPI002FF37C2F
MAGHNGIAHFSVSARDVKNYDISHENSVIVYRCPHCGSKTNAAVIAHTTGNNEFVGWSRCLGCGKGVVHNNGTMSPSTLAGEVVEGLPIEVEAAFLEARQTAGSGAFTSCELMCRKILMHIAADKGAQEGKTFVEYLDHLTTTGYITPPMRPWLDLIRTHGNLSTHRLEAASQERALNTLAFTTQLLRLVYEMEHRAQSHVTAP